MKGREEAKGGVYSSRRGVQSIVLCLPVCQTWLRIGVQYPTLKVQPEEPMRK